MSYLISNGATLLLPVISSPVYNDFSDFYCKKTHNKRVSAQNWVIVSNKTQQTTLKPEITNGGLQILKQNEANTWADYKWRTGIAEVYIYIT